LEVRRAALALVLSDTATPPFDERVAVPSMIVPSINVTVPVAFGLEAVTVAVKVIPVSMSWAGVLSVIVITVGILLMACTNTEEIDGL
jgi:hypothetical protein